MIQAKILFLPIAVSLTLAACARTETPEEARAAAQDAQAEYDRLAQQARGEQDVEDSIVGSVSPGQINTGGALTPGEWTAATVEGERVARFGSQDAPVLTIACEVGGGIDMRIVGINPPGGSSTVYVSAPEGGSTFTASDTIGDDPESYISVPASDPFIGRLISGNGPYSLRMGSETRINFPASDSLTSVVSACDRRASETADGGDDAEAETAAPEGSGE